jgi:hypothetical protein
MHARMSLRRSALGPASVRSCGEHRAGAEAGQLDEADEALARVLLALAGEGLVVDVEARLGVVDECRPT